MRRARRQNEDNFHWNFIRHKSFECFGVENVPERIFNLQREMYAIYKQTHPPTGVEHCVHCHFMSPVESNLVVAGTSQLRIYRFYNHEEVGFERFLSWVILFKCSRRLNLWLLILVTVTITDETLGAGPHVGWTEVYDEWSRRGSSADPMKRKFDTEINFHDTSSWLLLLNDLQPYRFCSLRKFTLYILN